ncbi:hypothetical protein ACFL1G_06400 [Planctomycetota bacterium]
MKHKKLKWKRVQKDRFDLQLLNPKEANVRQLRKLLRNVEISSANWRKNMNFNQRATKAFREWFLKPNLPLPGYSYALLSNWFKTSLKFIRESPRGQAALEFWKVMFCAVPERRLTEPKRNDKIKDNEFSLWWDKQQKYQKDC